MICEWCGNDFAEKREIGIPIDKVIAVWTSAIICNDCKKENENDYEENEHYTATSNISEFPKIKDYISKKQRKKKLKELLNLENINTY